MISETSCKICLASISTSAGPSLCSQTCKQIFLRERRRLVNQRRAARKSKAKANLTLKAWIRTFHRFGWCCAYCNQHPFETLDHLRPRAAGGALTFDNCLPSCQACNSRKGNKGKKRLDPDLRVQVQRARKILQTLVAETEKQSARKRRLKA